MACNHCNQEKVIEELKRRLEALEARPKVEEHHHYHYPPVQPFQIQPLYPPTYPWITYSSTSDQPLNMGNTIQNVGGHRTQ